MIICRREEWKASSQTHSYHLVSQISPCIFVLQQNLMQARVARGWRHWSSSPSEVSFDPVVSRIWENQCYKQPLFVLVFWRWNLVCSEDWIVREVVEIAHLLLSSLQKLLQKSTSLKRGYASSPKEPRAARTSIFTRATDGTALDILAASVVLMC